MLNQHIVEAVVDSFLAAIKQLECYTNMQHSLALLDDWDTAVKIAKEAPETGAVVVDSRTVIAVNKLLQAYMSHPENLRTIDFLLAQDAPLK